MLTIEKNRKTASFMSIGYVITSKKLPPKYETLLESVAVSVVEHWSNCTISKNEVRNNNLRYF